MIGAHPRCSRAILRVLMGVEPIEARFAFSHLCYLSKIASDDPSTPTNQIYKKYRDSNTKLPPGFFSTSDLMLKKYGIASERLEIPFSLSPNLKKNLLKKPIFDFHYDLDVAEILKPLFSDLMKIPNTTDRTGSVFPFCGPHALIRSLRHYHGPRSSISKIMRAWTTPFAIGGPCPYCERQSESLMSHIIFFCPKKTEPRNNYLSTLPPSLRAVWPDMTAFFRRGAPLSDHQFLVSFNEFLRLVSPSEIFYAPTEQDGNPR